METNDPELIGKALGGDYRAFEQLVLRYKDKVYRLALRLTRDEVDAEDVLQETFLNVYRKLDTFKANSSFSSWLYRITVNTSLMRMRRRRRENKIFIEDEALKYMDDKESERDMGEWMYRGDLVAQRKEIAVVVQEAINKLPEKYQLVFILRDVEGLSNQEVSDALNITVPTVKSRLHRSRKLLRRHLQEFDSEKGK